MSSDINQNEKNQAVNPEENKLGSDRRKVLKALAGLPVLGVLGLQVLRKTKYDKTHNLQKQILNELGLDDLMMSVKPVTESRSKETLRIGIVGFGIRGTQLSSALGFMEKSAFDKKLSSGSIDSQLKYGHLNVAITGICDVYDSHAEKGLEIARQDIFTWGEIEKKHPVKRYRYYHDMLADKNIDAVIISTPDHHHAQMTIDAVRAGKHVYCEKGIVIREDEIEKVYSAVKESGLVFQMGHQNPQNAVFQQGKEILRRGMLGNISQIETTTNRNSEEGAWIRHLDKYGKLKPGDEKSIDWKQWLGSAPYVPFSVKRYYSWARYFDYDTGLFGQLFSHEYDAINQLMNIGIPDKVVSTGGQYYYKDFGDIPDVLHTNFEYPAKGFTLTYSANLTSSKDRPRTIYGKDAWMSIGGDLSLTPDRNSEKYADMIKKGLVNHWSPMIEIKKGSGSITALDAVSSATTKYYEDRGLVSTNIGGQTWDLAHLHLKEWINCIRHGGTPSSDIEKAYEEGVTLVMADISYREGCITKWDPVKKKIIRL
jgi:predicted dehydrogenase